MPVVVYKRMASTTTLGDKTVQNRLNCIFNAEMQPVGAYANVFNTITYTYLRCSTDESRIYWSSRYHKNTALYVYKYYVKLLRVGTRLKRPFDRTRFLKEKILFFYFCL